MFVRFKRFLAPLAVIACFFTLSGAAVGQGSVGFTVDEDIKPLLDANRFSEAEQRLLKKDSPDPFLLAFLKLKQDKTEAAYALLSEHAVDDASRLKAVDVVASSSLGDALVWARRGLASASDESAKLSFKLALLELLSKSGNEQEAFQVADEILAQKPPKNVEENFSRVMSEFVIQLYKSGKSTKALSYLDRLMEQVPATSISPEYQLQWCHIATAAKQPLKALEKLAEIESNYPDYFRDNVAIFQLSRANAFEALEDIKRARKEYEGIKKLSATSPTAQKMMPTVNAKLEQFKDLGDGKGQTNSSLAQTPGAFRVSLIVLNVAIVVAVVILILMRRRPSQKDL